MARQAAVPALLLASLGSAAFLLPRPAPRGRLVPRRAKLDNLPPEYQAAEEELTEDDADAVMESLLAMDDARERRALLKRFLKPSGNRCDDLVDAFLAAAKRCTDKIMAGQLRRINFDASITVRTMYGDKRQELLFEDLEEMGEILHPHDVKEYDAEARAGKSAGYGWGKQANDYNPHFR